MGTLHYLHLLTVTLTLISVAKSHNITAILSAFPDYSDFNSYLSETKLADDINTRETVTVLVFPNSFMQTLASHPLSAIKNELSLHVLLDYFDNKKLHEIANGTILTTTLYQTTGNSPGNLGFVNITDLRGGKVGFGSGVDGSDLVSSYTKSVKQIPYNISVIEISQPIVVKEILDAGDAKVNLTALLEKAGCKTFAKLIGDTGVLKVFEAAEEKGLTIFAPNDEAFKSADVPDLNKLTNAEVVSLLQFHAVPSYEPKGALKTSNSAIKTLAANGVGKYDLTVKTSGDEVTLDSGVDTSRVASIVVDSTPLCVFTVDSVLLPAALFSKAPSSAPAPAPVLTPTPSPAEAPSSFASPPAPPTETPGESPAKSPVAEAHSDSVKSVANDLATPTSVMATVVVLSVSLFVL